MATVILSIVGLQKKTLIRYWVNLYLHSEHKNQFYITGKNLSMLQIVFCGGGFYTRLTGPNYCNE